MLVGQRPILLTSRVLGGARGDSGMELGRGRWLGLDDRGGVQMGMRGGWSVLQMRMWRRLPRDWRGT